MMRRILGFGCLGLIGLLIVVAIALTAGGGNDNTASNPPAAADTPQSAEDKTAAEKAEADQKAADEKADADKKAAEEKADADKKAAAEKAEAEKAVTLGKPATAGDFVWTIKKVSKKDQLTAQYMDPLKAQGTFVILDGEVANNGKEAKTIDGSSLKIIDGEGREFEASTETTGYITEKKDVFLTQLNPDLKRQIQVVFDVPTASFTNLDRYGKLGG